MKFFKFYADSFKGLSREMWYLSIIMFINRAGAMVIPFLSLYLTKSEGYSLPQVGWIMSAFGIGSVIGAWVGGQLTDTIGHYKTMVLSLILGGLGFIGLQYLHTFWTLVIGVGVVMIFVDSFRPAAFTAINAYSKPENKTRSVTLLRLAINLGFSMGPALGGLIITSLNYSGLFWVDGVTCVIAGFLLIKLLDPKTAREEHQEVVQHPLSPYKDFTYLWFILAIILFSLAFVQYFSVMPLFYTNIYALSEDEIGLLLALNGLVIFLLEMPLIKYLETKAVSVLTYIIWGTILTAFSFLILNVFSWIGLLIIGMLLMTIGEMIAFPFTNKFALDRAKGGKMGAYMALYSISFSISHIFGHNTGMNLVSNFGYTATWFTMAALLGIAVLIFLSIKLKQR
ncbi:MFS transporter [Croceibacter atlanticus]|uniref:MFS transporter n=1 Tax=Croceibacter atlanticus TaxID=313588 RepID=UPI0030FB0CD8